MSETIMRAGLDSSGYEEGARRITRANLEMMESAAKANSLVSTLESRYRRFGASSSTGYSEARQALESLQNTASHFRDTLDHISDRIIRIGATVIVFRALGEALQGLRAAVKEAFDYMSLIETSGLGIASSFLVVGEYIDTTKGKALNAQASFLAAQKDSKNAVDQLRVANMNTIATLDQLIVAYQVALPVAIRKGLNKDQVVSFTTAVMQMAGAIGQPFDQMSEEIRSLLGASPITKNSRMAQVLGLRPEDINQYKNDGQALIKFLMDKMQPFQIAGEESQKTWKGLISNLKDVGKIGLANAFEGTFSVLKGEFKSLMDHIVKFDNINKTATWNNELVKKSKEVGESITRITESLISTTKWIVEHREAIYSVIQAYFYYKVATTAVLVLGAAYASIYNVIQTVIGAFAVKNQALMTLGLTERANVGALELAILAERELVMAEAERRTSIQGTIVAQAEANAASNAAAASLIREAEVKARMANADLIYMEGKLAEAEATMVQANSNAVYYAALHNYSAATVADKTAMAAAQVELTLAEAEYKLALQATEVETVKANIVNKELIKARVAAINIDNEAVLAANRYNAALIRTGEITGFVSAAELRKVQTSFAQMAATQQSTIVTAAHSEALAMNAAIMEACSLQTRILTGLQAGMNAAFNMIGGTMGILIITIGSLIYAWNNLSEAEKKYQKDKMSDLANSPVTKLMEEITKKKKELADIERAALKESDPAKYAASEAEARLADVTNTVNVALKEKEKLLDRIQRAESAVYDGIPVDKKQLRADRDRLEIVEETIDAYGAQSKVLSEVNAKLDAEAKFKAKVAPVVAVKEDYSKEKSLLNAYLSFVASYYKDMIALHKEQSQTVQIQIDEAYKIGEMSQVEHINRTQENARRLMDMELKEIQRNKSMREQALNDLKRKAPVDIFDSKGDVKNPDELGLGAYSAKDVKAKEAHKNKVAMAQEMYKLQQEINSDISKENLLRENGSQSELKYGFSKAEAMRSMVKIQEDLNIEVLKSQGNDLEAFELSKRTLEYKRTIANVDQARLDYASEMLDKSETLSEEEKAYYLNMLDAAQEVIKYRNIQNALGENAVRNAKELERLELAKQARDTRQAASAFQASQVGVSNNTGTMLDEYKNAIAVEKDRHSTVLENIEEEKQKQIDIASNELNSMFERQKAMNVLIDLQRQLNEETFKHKQNNGSAELKEQIKAYESLAAQAQKAWPKIAGFQTAAKLLTKEYLTEDGKAAQITVKNAEFTNKSKLQMAQDYTGLASEFLVSLAASEDQNSRKSFEAAKKYNLAAAVMSTAAAAIGFLANPGGYPGIALAAMAAAMGAVQISKIASTSYGGGSAGGVSSGFSAGSSSGGAGGATGSAVGAPISTLADNISQKAMQKLANAAENASIALMKVSNTVTDMFAEGSLNQKAVSASPYFGSKDGYSQISGVGGGTASWGTNMMRSVTAMVPLIYSMFNGGNKEAMAYQALNNFSMGGGWLVQGALGLGNRWHNTGAGMKLGLKDGEFEGQQYINQSKDGGWFTSDKSRTVSKELDSAFAGFLKSKVDAIKSSLTLAAAVMGTTADFSGANLDLQKIKVSGKKPEDVQKKLEEYFAKVADALGKGVEGLQEYSFVGESAYDATIRLASSLQQVNESFSLVGATLIESSLKGANAAYKLIDVMGGTEAFSSKMDKYFTTMFSESEQAALKQKDSMRQLTVTINAANATYDDLNWSVPKTREEFRALISSLDVSTEKGAALFAALMEAVPAMDALITAVDTLKETASKYNEWSIRGLKATGNADFAAVLELIVKQEEELAQAKKDGYDTTQLEIVQRQELLKYLSESGTTAADNYAKAQDDFNKVIIDSANKLLTEATALASAWKSITDGLSKTKNGLMVGANSALGPEAQLNFSKNYLMDLYTKGMGGDKDAMGGVGSAATSYLELAKKYYGSTSMYAGEFSWINNLLDTAGSQSQQNVDYAEANAKAQQAIIDTLQKSEEQRAKDAQDAAAKQMAQMKVLMDGFQKLLDEASKQTASLAELEAEARRQAANG